MKKQMGFTLIELVVVVVLIGLLAANAIPRFLDLTEQAQEASIEGVAGGFATAISLARAQWEAEGRPNDTNNNNIVRYDGIDLVLTSETDTIRPGYALGATADVSTAGTVSVGNVDCLSVFQNILQQSPRATDNVDNINDQGLDYFVNQSGTGAGTLCHYFLVGTLAQDSDGDIQSPGTDTTVGNNFTYQPSNSEISININRN